MSKPRMDMSAVEWLAELKCLDKLLSRSLS